MQQDLRNELRNLIKDRLSALLKNCHSHSFSADSHTLELHVTENKESVSARIVIRLFFPEGSNQVHIPNISFPESWRGHRKGLSLIRDIFELCDRFGYPLFITQMTTNFYDYLLSIAARRTDEDTVEIMPYTRLVLERTRGEQGH